MAGQSKVGVWGSSLRRRQHRVAGSSVGVPVMRVRVVGMDVAHRVMAMRVRMLADRRPAVGMHMLMVPVVFMLVVVLHRSVVMRMLMLFR